MSSSLIAQSVEVRASSDARTSLSLGHGAVSPCEPETVPSENPEVYGFSEFVLPKVQIDYADAESRKHTLSVYRSYCLDLIAFEDRARGYARWLLGVVLNRLKPITGGTKSIPHGEFVEFVTGLGIKDDLAEEVRWVAEVIAREDARTLGWTTMRAIAIKARKCHNAERRAANDSGNGETGVPSGSQAAPAESGAVSGQAGDRNEQRAELQQMVAEFRELPMRIRKGLQEYLESAVRNGSDGGVTFASEVAGVVEEVARELSETAATIQSSTDAMRDQFVMHFPDHEGILATRKSAIVEPLASEAPDQEAIA